MTTAATMNKRLPLSPETATADPLPARFAAWSAGLGLPAVQSITKLMGDASARQYFRVGFADGTTQILMLMPAGTASASEEISNFRGTLPEPPFVQIARVLSACGLPVPRIAHIHLPERWIVLEDLGDQLLATVVAAHGGRDRLAWYQRAIDLLVRLQQQTAGIDPATCVAFQRTFDAALLRWEFDHFWDYALMARGKAPSTEVRQRFERETGAITQAITDMPSGFTHRDFQSRNLMLRDGTLVMIDFQDALVGAYVYDLVALLRDSYVELPATELDQLVGYYAQATGRDAQAVRLDFDLVTVQRKMKDAGRFVYIDQVKGNPGFLPFIPASLRYVKAALERLPQHVHLLEALTPYVPEWSA